MPKFHECKIWSVRHGNVNFTNRLKEDEQVAIAMKTSSLVF